MVFSLSIESLWTDENDNILYGSYDASLTQQLTEDWDLSADLIGLLTEVPLSYLCLSNMYIFIYLYIAHMRSTRLLISKIQLLICHLLLQL